LACLTITGLEPTTMQHLEEITYAYAKSSCYRCGGAGDAVDMDCFIDGEGALAICTTCLIDALTIAKPGRAKMRAKAKADAAIARQKSVI
jgi:hypothetical protein